jgi:glycerophosphoryl diester phosphodiesterase
MANRIAALWSPPVLFAHRGARAHAPENTLESFALAHRLGATGIETDAWLTRDSVVVLDHDGWHRRLLRKRLGDVDAADLKGHIPTLDQYFQEVDAGLPLSVDVKDLAVFAPLVATARRHNAAHRLWVCHPDLDQLRAWRDEAPEVHLVNSTRLEDLPFGPERRAGELAAARIDAVNLRHGQWSGGLTTLFHRFEVLCFAWDAQHEQQIARLIDSGIDAVYSDYVDRMVSVNDMFTNGEIEQFRRRDNGPV